MSKDVIRELSQREQAREKVSVWFGSKENFYHPFKEVLVNAVDEINNNFESGTVIVTLDNEHKKISVSDSGRGLPIEGKTNGKPNYELLLLTLFAGTNYSNNENGKETTGTNGVGLTVTNYCSTSFSVTSKRNGHEHKMSFANGGEIISPLKSTKTNTSETGTTISFELDPEVFTHAIYDSQEIYDIIKKTAGVSPKIKFKLIYNGETEFHYDNIKGYFAEIIENNTSRIFSGNEKIFEIENERNRIEVALTTCPEPIQQSFLNGTHLKEGGSINDGIINSVRRYINKYCKDNGLLKDKDGNISNDDVKDSLSFVCKFNSTNTEFSNQTKFSTKKKLYETISTSYIKDLMEIYQLEDSVEFNKLVNHILEVKKFNNKSSASKKALKKKLSEKVDSFTRLEGLVDCKKHGEESELFICEGKSALSSIVLARNPLNQAAIAIRGKIMNCLKSNLDEIFKSQIVTDIIKVLGCGIETDRRNRDLGEFNENALRYGKVIIATDMDADGFQIACLLLTLFYKLTPQLIHKGRVYIALTPLYEIKDLKNKKEHYAFSEEEKEKIIAGLEKYKVSRNKGLGELNAKIMAKTGVNPETRTIVKVDVDDAKEMIKAFEIWMDETVTERRNIIMNELDKYNDID